MLYYFYRGALVPRFSLKYMKKQLVTINLKKINWMSILMFVAPFLIGLTLKLTVFKDTSYGLGIWDILITIVGMLILSCVHECIHALAFLISGAPVNSIKFGAIPKKMMIYCTTNKPMSIWRYKFSLLSPFIILGLLPFVVSTILLKWEYVLLFSTMISGCAGDLMMFWAISKKKQAKLVLDHPSAPAFYLLYDESSLPEDFVEVTEEMEINLIKNLK